MFGDEVGAKLGFELNLMRDYPKPNDRSKSRPVISEENRKISRRFGQEYFDGDRRYGYGGYTYDKKFWAATVKNFTEHYELKSNSSILDIGCAKGFMLKDFKDLLPNSRIKGIDISNYAIRNAHLDVKNFLIQGNAMELPFSDGAFDLVISINTIHNLKIEDCVRSLKEIQRVSKGNSFVMVDGWRSKVEKENLEAWVLTAQTILSVEKWVELFNDARYTGDYAFWTV
jgi:ubiquinone/menaquinone biosynthesis C-methylase UbiE